MKFKNEDGTVNALPIVAIFTIFSIALYIVLFGLDIKEKIEEVQNEKEMPTIKSTEQATMSLCNGCTFGFTKESYDVSINGKVDLKEIMNVYKTSVNYMTFESENPELFTVEPLSSSFVIKTGNKTGSAKIIAKYVDKTAEATINVLSADNIRVRFKYNNYFVQKGKEITPEIDAYPLSVNLDDVVYCVNKSNEIISCSDNENKVQGYEVGKSIYTIRLGKQTASTTINVVENLITIKVNNGESYKPANEVNPSGNSFDFVLNYTDVNKDRFDNKDIDISFDSNPLNARVTYIGPDKTKNSYVYHVDLDNGTTGTSTMRVKLSN